MAGFKFDNEFQKITVTEDPHAQVWWMVFEVNINGETYRTVVTAPHYLTPQWVRGTYPDGLKYDRYQIVAKGLRELADMLDRYHPQPTKKGWNGTWRE